VLAKTCERANSPGLLPIPGRGTRPRKPVSKPSAAALRALRGNWRVCSKGWSRQSGGGACWRISSAWPSASRRSLACCGPTASHYLKLLLDAVFCAPGGGFRNEIVWCYSHGGRSRKWFGRKHDIIFFYGKTGRCYFDPSAVRAEMRSGTRSFGGRLVTGDDGRKYRLVYGTKNSHGVARYYKYYLDEGKLPEDWWADINSLQASAAERIGYPTQKPEALLLRILAACSQTGETVLDAYCGSGTTLVAAERIGRAWVGIDLAPQAIALTLERLKAEFGSEVAARIAVSGAG
jgi:site-specific DNA-methyltransferase (adenine-specific)